MAALLLLPALLSSRLVPVPGQRPVLAPLRSPGARGRPRCAAPAVIDEPQPPLPAAVPFPPGELLQRLRDGAAAGASPLDLLPRCFPYTLDGFQLDAMRAMHEGRSVVISAPTGSGKTAIAEIGMYAALARGERAIYTTPLKALSNQKFGDLQRILGPESVGLLTGDSQVQRDASVLVMTTEVYRNMLLAQEPMIFGGGGETAAGAGEGGSGGADTGVSSGGGAGLGMPGASPRAGRVGVVILDEFHYMNDVSRGTVWEECCILSPPSAQLVALSATMANAHRITSWLEAIHGPTTLVETSFRPVPLRYWYADDLGLESLFSEAGAGPGAGGKHGPKGWRMNAVLAPERRAAERERMYGIPPGGTGGREGGRGDGGAREAGRRGSQKWSRRGDSGGGRPDRSRSGEGGEGAGGRGGGDRQSRYSLRQRAQSEIAPMPTLLRELSRRSLLPAIAFIFSRVGCDAAAEAAARLRTPLVSRSEQREIEALLRAFEAKNGALIDSLVPRRFELLRLGIASHHAGMLPLEKGLVEQLFQRNLLKVVFSTETLAAGINMPARSTVVTVLSKRGDRGIEPLSASALLQMAGRAGRRGQDSLGNVILCRSAFESAPDAFALLRRPPDAIASHFCVSYGSALKMRRARPLAECQQLLRKSFGAFTARSTAAAAASRLDAVTAEQRQLSSLLSSYPPELLSPYAKLRARRTAEQRSLSYLQSQEAQAEAELAASLLAFVARGTPARTCDGVAAIVADDAPPKLLRRMRHAEAAGKGRRGGRGGAGEDGGDPMLLLLEDGTFRCAGAEHIAALFPESALPLPAEAQRLIDASVPQVEYWRRRADGAWEAGQGGDTGEADELAQVGGPASHGGEAAPGALVGEAFESELLESGESGFGGGGIEGWDGEVGGGGGEMEGGSVSLPGVEPAASVSSLRLLVPPLPTPSPSPAVLKQLARVARLTSQMEEHPLHSEPRLEHILDAAEKAEALKVQAAKLERRAGRAAARAGAGAEGVTAGSAGGAGSSAGELADLLSSAPPAVSEDVLAQFGAVGEVLRQYGALDAASEDGWAATEFGELVASLSGENELWLALVLMEAAATGALTPPQLAAVLSTTLDERLRPNTFVSTVPSEAVFTTVATLSDRAASLQAAQFSAGLSFPVGLEVGACGLVEAWAGGSDWGSLVASTSLDLGDIYRLLRRSVDLLKQVSNVPYVSDEAKACARMAVRAMDRYPIADDALMALPEDMDAAALSSEKGEGAEGEAERRA